MIKDSLANIHKYDSQHKNFRSVFNILEALNFQALEPGRIELDTDYVYINIDRIKGKDKTSASLESHLRYIDIQLPINTTETIGYKPTSECRSIKEEYDPQRDISFYNDSADEYITVNPGEFVIFFPEDAHAPAIADGEIFKIVVKVSVKPNSERPTL